MSAALGGLMDAVSDLVRTTPVLRDFVRWPDALPPAALRPHPVPCIPLIEAMTARSSTLTAPTVDAVRAAAKLAHWQQTYTEAEVGRDFLNRYGWFELVGPRGHFRSSTTRAFIAWWGEDLKYAMHLHEAEELYYVLAGQAEFHAEGQPTAMIGPEGTRQHVSGQRHAMDTHADPVLALVLWRGAGLQRPARMDAA